MKVGIFVDTHEPHVSGITTSVNMLKNALESMHHTVYIVTANLSKMQFKYDEKNKIIYLPGIKTGIYETRLTEIYSTKAMKIIKDWNLDVIHSQTEFGVGLFSRKVSKKLNIPVVHTYHTLYEDYVHYVTHGHFNNLAKKLAIKLTKYFCDKNCDELIVPTDKIKDLFIKKYGINRDINVIPTGIDTKKFKPTLQMKKNALTIRHKYNIKDDEFVIGAIGRIAEEKSFDKLIINYKELLELNNNIRLMLVGDGPYLNNLKTLVKENNLDNKVIFTNLIDYKEIPVFYTAIDAVVSYSKTETQGLTIIEGLANGKPTVCINDKSFTSMIENNYNGFLFNSHTEFNESILKLMNNKELYKEMSLNAINSVYKYSKEVFASDILKVYFKAIKNSQK
jgi:1,2-diacylglycerol 3-alpha-glucosyltransferase